MYGPLKSRMKTWALLIVTICAVIVASAYRAQAVGGNAGQQQRRRETPKSQQDPKGLRIALSGTALQPFVGKLQLGDPPQGAFKVLFDTGSPRLWVMSNTCDLNNATWTDAGKHARFAAGRSFTYKQIEGNMGVVKYPDILGTQLTYRPGTETVHFEDSREPGRLVQLPEQPLAVVCWMYGESSRFDPPTDGVAGLRFPSSEIEIDLPMYGNTAVNELSIGQPYFTFYTFGRPTANASQQVAGELTFGGELDKMRYAGPISWAPVTRTPDWEIRVHAIELVEGGEAAANTTNPPQRACVHGCQALLKTGAKYIEGPQADVAALNKRLGFVRSGNFFIAPHTCAEHEPRNLNLVFQIAADSRLELAPEMLWFDAIAGGRQHCVSTLKAHDDNSSWTLGVPFISNFYTIFHHGHKRVGFARPVRARSLRD